MGKNKGDGMKIDLHVHSIYSDDASLTPDQIVKLCKIRDIDGIALLDPTFEGWKLIKDKMMCIRGCEIKTNFGEVVGIFINEPIKTRNFYSVADEIKDQDGLLGLPHPFDFFRVYSFYRYFTFRKIPKDVVKKINYVEGFNSRCLLNSFNKRAQLFATKHDLSAVAVSDSHTIYEVGNAYIEINEGEDLIKTLREGDVKMFGRLSCPCVHPITIMKKTNLLLAKYLC